mgnify:CR=1 FL=1
MKKKLLATWYGSLLLSIFFPAVLLALWEALARTGALDQRFFRQPSEIGGVLLSMLVSGELIHDILISLRRIFIGATLLVGLLESFSSFWASAFKEVIVFTLIIPVLLWRSLTTHHHEEEE